MEQSTNPDGQATPPMQLERCFHTIEWIPACCCRDSLVPMAAFEAAVSPAVVVVGCVFADVVATTAASDALGLNLWTLMTDAATWVGQLHAVVAVQADPSEVATASIPSVAASVTSLADIESLGKEVAVDFEFDASTAPKIASTEVRVLLHAATAGGDEEGVVEAVSARRSFVANFGMTTVDGHPRFDETSPKVDPSRIQIFGLLAGVDADVPQHGGCTDSSSRGQTQPTGKCHNHSSSRWVDKSHTSSRDESR